MTRLRVVTYNVRGLRHRADVARVLRELDPDVVCLQEAPSRPGWRGRYAALARQAHLLYAGGGGTTGGTALLTATRVDVRDVQECRLRHTPGLRRRGVVLAALGKGRAPFGVASIQLGLDQAERARHLTDITGLVHQLVRPDEARLGLPVAIIAGDLEETAQAPTWTRLAAQYADIGAADPVPMFPAPGVGVRTDGIFVRGAVEVESCRVLDSATSGRRPVVADLVLPDQ